MNDKLITLVIPTINPDYVFNNNQLYKNFNVVIIYDKDHNGAGWARNKGLELVTTPYVVFMDDDDYLSPTAIGIFDKIIKDEHPEVILGRVTRVFQDNSIIDDIGDSYSAWTWLHGKCYSMELLNKYNIRFPDGIIYNEDVYFNTILRNHVKEDNIIKVETTVYFFVANDNSICHKMYKDIEKRKKERLNAITVVKLALPYIDNELLLREQLERFYLWTNDAIHIGVNIEDIPNSLPDLLSRGIDYTENIIKFKQYGKDVVTGKPYEMIPWREFKEKFEK